jgi:HD-like signal output (HDOD) protein
MYNADRDDYEEIIAARQRKESRIKELERNRFGLTHKEVGAQVLAAWNFPDIYVDASREHGMLNITSEHRTFIILISIADMLSDLLISGELLPEKQETLNQFMRYAGISDDMTGYFTEKFVPRLREDPLFKETQSMFQFSY